jgi:hypothetical protein
MRQSKNYKFYLILSLLIVILLLVFRNVTYNHFQLAPLPAAAPTPILKSVTTIIDLDNKKVTSFTRDISATDSALSLLQAVAARENLPLVTKQYSFGTLVEAIAGQKNTPNRAWIYFVNNQSASVGAASYKPAPGDVIEWKYLKPAF